MSSTGPSDTFFAETAGLYSLLHRLAHAQNANDEDMYNETYPYLESSFPHIALLVIPPSSVASQHTVGTGVLSNRVFHYTPAGAEPPRNSHTCGTCHRRFRSHRYLSRHTRVHSRPNPAHPDVFHTESHAHPPRTFSRQRQARTPTPISRMTLPLETTLKYNVATPTTTTVPSIQTHDTGTRTDERVAERLVPPHCAVYTTLSTPAVPRTATTGRNAGIGPIHGNRPNTTAETVVQGQNAHLRTWPHFPHYPIHPTPRFTSRSQHTPAHSRPHSHQAPSLPPFSSSPAPNTQTHPTRTPLATTTLTCDVTQRVSQTDAQNVTRSHEAATLTDVHAGMRTAATHAMTREDATHTEDAARQTRETPTQAQAASHDVSTRADAHHQGTTQKEGHSDAMQPRGDEAQIRDAVADATNLHATDLGDTRTHTHRSDAGSITAPTTSSSCIPSLPVPPSLYHPVSSVPRLCPSILSPSPVRRPCPLIIPFRSADGSASFPVSSLHPCCFITSISQLQIDEQE
jgi:hypothetical protein